MSSKIINFLIKFYFKIINKLKFEYLTFAFRGIRTHDFRYSWPLYIL